jgi:hypothetical protein
MNNQLINLNEIDNIQIAQSRTCCIGDFLRQECIKSSDFTIVSQNIRSIYKNFDDLLVTLTQFKFDTDVIALNECWIHQNKPLPQMLNYTCYSTTNHSNHCDGVVVYLKNTFKGDVKEINVEHVSCLQITASDLIVLCFYRSPANHNAEIFINSLNTHLDTLKTRKNIIITGDININLIQKWNETYQERTNRLLYLNMLAMHGLLPGHTLPTRDSNCIDHFILKLDRCKNSAFISVIDSTVTDHQMIFLKLSYTTTREHISPKTKTSFNIEGARKYLTDNNITDMIHYDNPVSLTNDLINILRQCILSNTITRSIPNKERLIKPWITVGIVRCIRNRNNMQAKLRSDPYNSILKITYKRYRNYCNGLIKKIKQKYERDQLLKNKNNQKSLWKTINNITYRNLQKTQNLELLKTSISPIQSVNLVNDYFINIGKRLAEDIISDTSSQNRTGLTTQNISQVSSFVLIETDPKEVYLTLMSLKSDSAPGWDNINTKFLKHLHELLVNNHPPG